MCGVRLVYPLRSVACQGLEGHREEIRRSTFQLLLLPNINMPLARGRGSEHAGAELPDCFGLDPGELLSRAFSGSPHGVAQTCA
eukprot:15464233-Alexandrium_andersonii.AAC.1